MIQEPTYSSEYDFNIFLLILFWIHQEDTSIFLMHWALIWSEVIVSIVWKYLLLIYFTLFSPIICIYFCKLSLFREVYLHLSLIDKINLPCINFIPFTLRWYIWKILFVYPTSSLHSGYSTSTISLKETSQLYIYLFLIRMEIFIHIFFVMVILLFLYFYFYCCLLKWGIILLITWNIYESIRHTWREW